MTPEKFQSFADNYTHEDFDRISFRWEGGYGDELKDKNIDFRMQLCEWLLPQIHQVRLELLKDLYLEIGKASEYTLGCYIRFHLLGQELLERGGTTYLKAYLQGAANTMDTALVSSKIQLSKDRAIELLEYFDYKMKNPADQEDAKLYNDYFRPRFERLANGY
ncbi:MAG TPA: hypothetical protein VGE79_05055 [Niastella sp.]